MIENWKRNKNFICRLWKANMPKEDLRIIEKENVATDAVIMGKKTVSVNLHQPSKEFRELCKNMFSSIANH